MWRPGWKQVLFFAICVPARVGPLAIAQYEDLGDAAGADRTLAVQLGLNGVLAVKNRYLAEALVLGVGKLEPDQSAAIGLKLCSGSQYFRLMLPLRFAGADDDGFRWDEFS